MADKKAGRDYKLRPAFIKIFAKVFTDFYKKAIIKP